MKSNVKTARLTARLPFFNDLDASISFVVFVAALALFLRTMPPTVLEGDSAEYQHMAYYLGVPHSSGYPLYLLLAKLFTFLPFGDIAFRVNLLSSVSAAATVPFVYLSARRLSVRRSAAVLSTALLAVTPSVWGGAVQAKTYALHLLIGVICVWFALRWHQGGRPFHLYGMALAFGLGLVNHHVIVFLAPALAFILWLDRSRLTAGLIARSLALVVIPLVLYLYLPLRAGQLIAAQDPENWKLYTREDAILRGQISSYYRHTLDGFLNLVTGFDNSYKLKSPLDDDRLRLVVSLLWQQFGLAGIVLALLGAVESFRRSRQVFGFVLLTAVGIGAIGTILRGLSAVYYFSLAYFALALWIALGFDWIFERAVALPRYVTYGVSAAGLVLVLVGLLGNWSMLDRSSDVRARDNAQAILSDRLEQKAVVIAPWEVSEPIHYYQFVENQRPDLLVTNVSPVTKQFETMLKNAHALGRPFYLAQFTPELRNGNERRSVQAIPLPLQSSPDPFHRLKNAKLAPEVQVLGYDLDPDPPQPGQPTRLWLYYRAAERMYPMYSAKLNVSDVLGRPWQEIEGFPVSLYFPTYRWYELGEYYRDGWVINLPTTAPPGLYNLELTWYVYDLETHKADYEHSIQLSLGHIRVGSLGTPQIEHPLAAKFGGVIEFQGWSLGSRKSDAAISVSRGENLNLDLLWRADEALSQSYTIFVHLVDGSGRVIADADSPPMGGMLPTNAWMQNEFVKDRHVLTIPVDAAPGIYRLDIGVYSPAGGERLQVAGIGEATDHVSVGEIQVR